ncbi:MAG: histidine kinase dimerization/phosphoacceptor domain -containing protein [Actinomycetota bacterium]
MIVVDRRNSDADEYSRALLNILDDFGAEKTRLESTQRAMLNLLEDFDAEKTRLESTQRAMLNLLDDFDAEKTKAEGTSGELTQLLKEREVLLKEVHHRVKNNLQVVSSLLGLQAGHFNDTRLRQALEESQNRVFSIALVHENLYRSKDLAQVEFSDYVHSLVDNLPRSSSAGMQVSVTQDIEACRLSIETAVPCGLIINELVTNALKHAFPGEGHGLIRVVLQRVDPSNWMLLVADDGIGLPLGIDMKKTESLGLELVSLLVKQISGSLEIKRDSGTSFQVTFPSEA